MRFSKRDEADKYFQDVQDGILRQISVGYNVHEFEELAPTAKGERIFRATDWEPMELSIVTINADAGAQVRNGNLLTTCNLITREVGVNEMEVKPNQTAPESPGAAPQADPKLDETKIRAEATANAIKVERERSSSIRTAASSLGLEESFVTKLAAINPTRPSLETGPDC